MISSFAYTAQYCTVQYCSTVLYSRSTVVQYTIRYYTVITIHSIVITPLQRVANSQVPYSVLHFPVHSKMLNHVRSLATVDYLDSKNSQPRAIIVHYI